METDIVIKRAVKEYNSSLHNHCDVLRPIYPLGLPVGDGVNFDPPNGMHAIVPQLYLGNSLAANTLNVLKKHGITHILALGPFVPMHAHVKYKILNVFDLPSENLIQYFDETNEFIEQAMADGGQILVHCQAGVSRSATIVAAYLMHARRATVEDALAAIREKRSCIDPNPGFIEQLKLYHFLRFQVDTNHPAYKAFLRLRSGVDDYADKPYVIPLIDRPEPTAPAVILRCKKCRFVVARGQDIIPHTAGAGQQAFAYTKRSIERQITTPSQPPVEASKPLHPILARLAAHKNKCTSVFVEPLEWIEEGSVEGRIDCPQCFSKLGAYNWAGAQCSCGQWITPAFMIHGKQIDQINSS